MAGPTATVLLANELTRAQSHFLGDVIHAISDHVSGDDFYVITTRPIGGTADFASRPFVSSFGRSGDALTFDYSESELEQFEDLLNFSPTVALSFAAMCNDRLDHEILARLCCHVATKFNGLVDLHGAINCDPATHSGIYKISYTNHLYQSAFRHVCHPGFLATYLTHDAFRMVK